MLGLPGFHFHISDSRDDIIDDRRQRRWSRSPDEQTQQCVTDADDCWILLCGIGGGHGRQFSADRREQVSKASIGFARERLRMDLEQGRRAGTLADSVSLPSAGRATHLPHRGDHEDYDRHHHEHEHAAEKDCESADCCRTVIVHFCFSSRNADRVYFKPRP